MPRPFGQKEHVDRRSRRPVTCCRDPVRRRHFRRYADLVTGTQGTPPSLDVTTPNVARMYDYYATEAGPCPAIAVTPGQYAARFQPHLAHRGSRGTLRPRR